jgi:hypothetical protein
MFPSVIDAYTKEGFVFEFGSPGMLWTGLTPREHWRPRWKYESTSYRQIAISIRDAWFFMLIARALDGVNTDVEQSGLIIGNSFGISTIMMGELMRPASIDAIDAEVSTGSDEGSDLTRRVAKRLGLDIQLTKGFSTQDLDAACRREKYSFVLVDGEHTNTQIVEDFEGIKDRLTDRCVVFFHDVGLRDMDEGWLKVQEIAKPMGLLGYDLSATDSGSSLLVRGVPELEQMLRQSCPGLRAYNDIYHAGLNLEMPKPRTDTDTLVVGDSQRVAFFGAGNDLADYGQFILRHRDQVAGIFDDDPAKVSTTRYGIEVRDGSQLVDTKPDAIVISTHGHVDQARERVLELMPLLATSVYPRHGLAMPTRVLAIPGED